MSNHLKRGALSAAVALMALAGPIAAQSTSSVRETEIVVQNNRDKPVTVFLDTRPYEIRVGEVGAFETAEIQIPQYALRGHERMKVYFIPRGQFGYEGEMVFEDRYDHSRRFGVVVPSRKGQVQVDFGPVRVEEIAWTDDSLLD